MDRTIYPSAFIGPTPPERIIGTETEYASNDLVRLRGEPLGPALNHLGYNTTRDTAGTGHFVDSGARVYFDMGKLLEVATPEARGPLEATIVDFAGMSIINRLGVYQATGGPEPLGTTTPAYRISGSYMPATSTEPPEYVTVGRHGNYLLPRPGNDETNLMFREVLSAYIATRAIWDGCGIVMGRYGLSQKTPGIGVTVLNGHGHRTVEGGKPMGELLGPQDGKFTPGWTIFEDRSVDAHMSRMGTLLSVGAVSLVLRLLEQGIINQYNADDFTLREPIGVLKNTNYHFGKGVFDLESGAKSTAAELQQRFIEAMSMMASSEDRRLPDSEIGVAERLQKLSPKLSELDRKDPDYEVLSPEVEWATKLHYLRTKYGEDFCNKKTLVEAVAFDRQWHQTDEKSIGQLVYKRLDPDAKQLDEPIEYFRTHPPQTRAAARSRLLSSAACTLADWNLVKLVGSAPSEAIELDDPYSSRLPGDIMKHHSSTTDLLEDISKAG